MSRTSPLRVLAAGTLWALVYNLTWGVAWFTFMRREWVSAVAAIDRPLPWTPRFWLMWAVLTLPFGIAIMAYILGRVPSPSGIQPWVQAWYSGFPLRLAWLYGGGRIHSRRV